MARAYSDAEYNLDGFRAWLESLGNPQNEQMFLHIAGTRGKGSTAAIAEGLLRGEGFDTALFSSPHLAHYGERFRFNGTCWTKENFEAALERLEARFAPEHRKMIEGPQPYRTVFEILTTLALIEFRERERGLREIDPQRRQIAIWETGLGGRLDCTNVVDPVVSVITTISFDHMHLLGDTIEKIAAEKAGIIKPGRPVVIARQTKEQEAAVLPVFVKRAAEVGAPLIRAWEHNPVLESEPVANGQRVRVRLPDGHEAEGVLPLHGVHQLGNLEAALAAAWYVSKEEKRRICGDSFAAGLAQVSWPGRLEVLRNADRALVLDGAHCPLGARIIAQTLAKWEAMPESPAKGPWRLLWGMQKDKEHREFLRAFIENLGEARLEAVHCYKVSGVRGAEANTLAEVARDLGVEATAHESESAALEAASSGEGSIISLGTLYTIARFRDLWEAG